MIAYGGASARTEILLNIDPVGLDEDPYGGTKQVGSSSSSSSSSSGGGSGGW